MPLLSGVNGFVVVLMYAEGTLFEADDSIAPRVMVLVMVFDYISPCWLVQWPATVVAGNVSQSVTVLFQMQFSWCPILPDNQLFSCSVVDDSVQLYFSSKFKCINLL